MSKPYTTAQIAAFYSITPRRILAIAKARGVESTKYGGVGVWTAEQRKALKPGKPGRPRLG